MLRQIRRLTEGKWMRWLCVIAALFIPLTIYGVKITLFQPVKFNGSGIFLAIEKDVSVSTLDAMLTKSPDLIHEKHNFYRWTPLAHAIMYGTSDAVKCLIDHGSDVNEKPDGPGTGWGDPPIHMAVRRERLEVLKLLIQSGARQDAVNKMGSTIFDLVASGYGGDEMKEFVQSLRGNR